MFWTKYSLEEKNNIPGSFDIFGSCAVKLGRIAAYHAMKHLFWKNGKEKQLSHTPYEWNIYLGTKWNKKGRFDQQHSKRFQETS